MSCKPCQDFKSRGRALELRHIFTVLPMEDNEDFQLSSELRNFWHYLKYNPASLFDYWLKHMKRPSEEFWMMLNWNSPSF
jgi:hypothetical protein